MGDVQVAKVWNPFSWSEAWGFPARKGLVAVGLAVLILVLPASAVAEPTTAKRVMILESFSDRSLSAVDLMTSALRAQVPLPMDFNVEYLGGRRFDEKGYKQVLVETLRHTYSGANLDLVLVQSYTGLAFAVRHRHELFPEVPIIFLDVDPDQISGQKMWPSVTGVTAASGIGETTDLAPYLHPNTNTAAVITGDSTPDRYFLGRIHTELLRHQDKVSEVDLVALPT